MNPGEHRRTLHRVEHDGHARFLTFSCYKRLPLLKHEAIKTLFVARLQKVMREHDVRLLGWVIMPEHVHLLLFPNSVSNMERLTHATKRPFAEAVLRRWKELNAPILQQLRNGNGFRYWQTGGGYDRNLLSQQAVLEKLNYIHENPVRRKLVPISTEYVWSSAGWYDGSNDAKLPCDSMPW